MSRSMKNMLEALENRQLMAVTLSSFTVSDSAVISGQNLTMTVNAVASGPDSSIVAATFFNDVNNNGVWNAGIDVDLGATFAPFSGSTYRKTIVVPGNWTGTINLVADAVSNLGNWSNRQTNSVRVNPRPTISSFNISSNSFNLVTPLDLTSVVADDTSVRAVTWFLDRDFNGAWTPGLDTSLATRFNPSSGSTYTASVTANSSWPQVAQILTDVQDNDLDWALATVDVTTTQATQSRPAVTNLRGYTKFASMGPGGIQFQVDASDNSAVFQTSYFMDLDLSGGLSSLYDQSLGTTRLSSASATYTFSTITDFAGQSSVQFAADAQDFDGLSASSRALVTVNNDIVAVTSFAVALNSVLGNGDRLFDSNVGFLAPTSFGRTGTLAVHYNFFVDVNGNSLFDSSTDTFLSTSAATFTRGVIFNVTPQLTIPSSISGTPRICAFVTDSAETSEISTSHFAAIRGDLIQNVPAVTFQVADVGGITQPFVIPGAPYTVAGNWAAGAGGAFVTLFWDKNSNGRWDNGTDIDLGFQAITGSTGSFSFSGTVTTAMVGYGQFATAIKDLSAIANDEWSAPFTARTFEVFRAPTLSNGVNASGTAGSSVAIDFNATDDFGIRAVSGFIDSNGNGLFDGGESSTSGAAYSPLSGTTTSGTWRLVVNTTGLSAGTYTVYVAANDFYRGDVNAPGGATTGFWSSRLAITLTLT